MKRLLTLAAIAVLATLLVVAALPRFKRATDAPRDTSTSASDMSAMGNMDMGSDRVATLTPEQIRTFGITFGTAEVRVLSSEARAYGVVTVDETQLTQVVPRFAGFVERLYVNATGQRVRRGEPLMDVYAPDLVATQRELLVAVQLERDLGSSPVPGATGTPADLVDAARQRLRLWDISEAQIDSMLRTGTPRRLLTLYAPTDGVVLDRKVMQGQAVGPGTELFTIASLATLWIDVQLREADAALIRPGSVADFEVTGLPGRRRTGRVSYVYPSLDSTTRALRARIVVANPDGVLKPGMYATVRLSTPSRRALAVPNDAVLRGGDRNTVFVDMGNGRLMPHAVELGLVTDMDTEILAGLEPGQRVVTSAQFLLDSESNLGEVMRSMIGQMGPGDRSQGASMSDMPGMSMKPPTQPPPAPKR